jgi:hypothetical protein
MLFFILNNYILLISASPPPGQVPLSRGLYLRAAVLSMGHSRACCWYAYHLGFLGHKGRQDGSKRLWPLDSDRSDLNSGLARPGDAGLRHKSFSPL